MRIAFLAAVVVLLAVHAVRAQEAVSARDTVRRIRTGGNATTAGMVDYGAVRRNLERGSKKGFFDRVADFARKPLFGRSPDVKFRANGMAGVGYSQETNVMLVASLRGYYNLCEADSIATESYTAFTGNVSVSGFYRLRFSGDTFLGCGDHRLTYNIQASTLPVKFWGLGYDAADRNPRTKYTRDDCLLDVRYMRRVAGGFSAGASLDLRYAAARSLDELGAGYIAAAGQRRSAISTGLGVVLEYDTRDSRYRTTKGLCMSLLTEVRPKGLGDCGATLWHIMAVADFYTPLWCGSVLAVDLYGDLWSSATPWLFWPSLGGASRLRGYYTGRYSDRKMITAQVELRQRIRGPFGMCVWGGAGNVFPSHKLIDASKTLPNCGLGFRMEMGPKAVLRIDYGFGQHSNGLVINVNEAF